MEFISDEQIDEIHKLKPSELIGIIVHYHIVHSRFESGMVSVDEFCKEAERSQVASETLDSILKAANIKL